MLGFQFVLPLPDLRGADALHLGSDDVGVGLPERRQRIDTGVAELLRGRRADAAQVFEVLDSGAGLVLLVVADGTAKLPGVVTVASMTSSGRSCSSQ